MGEREVSGVGRIGELRREGEAWTEAEGGLGQCSPCPNLHFGRPGPEQASLSHQPSQQEENWGGGRCQLRVSALSCVNIQDNRTSQNRTDASV